MDKHRPFEVEIPIPVQTYDIDLMGIASNISYTRWLEDLRLKLLSTYYPLEKLLQNGIGPVLVQTHIEFKRPVRILDQLVGHMWVSRLDSPRWELKAEFLRNGKIAARAEQSGVFVRIQDGHPVPVPEELMRQYIEFQQNISTAT